MSERENDEETSFVDFEERLMDQWLELLGRLAQREGLDELPEMESPECHRLEDRLTAMISFWNKTAIECSDKGKALEPRDDFECLINAHNKLGRYYIKIQSLRAMSR